MRLRMAGRREMILEGEVYILCILTMNVYMVLAMLLYMYTNVYIIIVLVYSGI